MYVYVFLVLQEIGQDSLLANGKAVHTDGARLKSIVAAEVKPLLW